MSGIKRRCGSDLRGLCKFFLERWTADHMSFGVALTEKTQAALSTKQTLSISLPSSYAYLFPSTNQNLSLLPRIYRKVGTVQ